MDEFIDSASWFDKMFRQNLGFRYPTMKMALNLFKQNGGKTIVETGTTRLANDWGAGMSTYVFGEYLTRYGGKITTVDIEPGAIETCRAITTNQKDVVEYVIDDSIHFLESYGSKKPKIDLLYLDSFDYPYFEMLNDYGGKENLEEAIRQLNALSLEKILEIYGPVITPSQEHQLKELKIALPLMNDIGIILLDDNELAGGGKTRLSKKHLTKIGATCIFDYQQSLWML